MARLLRGPALLAGWVALAAAAAACAGATPSPPPTAANQADPQRAAISPGAAAGLAASAAEPSSTPPLWPLPGPAPRDRLAPIAGLGLPSDRGCAGCHEEIAAEWSASLHRRSWQNDYFVRSYASEPQPFCRTCHAPTANPAAEPALAAREIGVGCTTCHVVPGGVVGTRSASLRAGGHEVLGDARMTTPEACAGCHEFAFPGASNHPGAPMQNTIAEHGRSAAAATSCQGCHMPMTPSKAGGNHRHHGFRVQGDRAMMAQAVVVESASLAAAELRLELAPGKIGHAFPTGDVLRQVEVRVTALDAAGRPFGPESIEILGRTFGPAPPGSRLPGGRVQRADSRLSGPRSLRAQVAPGARRARWQIVWQRLPPWLAARLGMTMSDHESVVLEGTVSR